MRLLLLALTASILAGCSAVSSEADAVPERSSSDLATVRARAGISAPTPTTRSATSTPSIAQATATPKPKRQDRGFATDDVMRATLIEPGDISPEWTMGGNYGLGIASFCGEPAIDERFQALGAAYGSFSASKGERAEQWVVRLTESDALDAMEYARNSLTCNEQIQPLQGGSNAYWAFDEIQSSLVADDVHALSVKITFQNPAFTPRSGNVIFARHGEFVVVIVHDGFTIQPDLIVRMAQSAIDRLAAVGDSSV